MFDVSWQELALIVIVALLVIPPRDLPRAMATAGRWMRQAKAMMRRFHQEIDEIMREAELEEMRRHAEEAAKLAKNPIDLPKLTDKVGDQ